MPKTIPYYTAFDIIARMQARREEGKGESFSGHRDVLGAPPLLRNTEKGVPDGFFLTSNMHKIHFRPKRTGRAYDAPPDP